MRNTKSQVSTKYQRYSAYKRTGIEWLGDIPDRWQTKRLKFVALSNTSSLPENTPEEFRFKYLDIGNVGTGFVIAEPEEMEFDDAPSRARRIVTQHDTIISTVRTYLKAIYYFEEKPHDIIVSTGFAVISPGNALHSKYFYYLSLSASFIDSIVSNSYGVSYPAINESFLMTLPVWYPKFDEQKRIVEFLDRKTALIDDVINRKQKLIKLLQEKRQALITHAVTKGLNPNAKLKPSGIDWLGNIPKTWDVKRLKFVSRLEYGNSLPDEQRNIDGDVEVYGSNGTIGYHDISITDGKTIIIGRKGSYGKITWVNQACFAVDTTYFVDSRFTINDLRWLYYLLSCLRLDEGNQDTGVPGLSRELAYSLQVPVPSLKRQCSIADFLDRKTAKIDEIVTKIKSQVWKLREYKHALITSAVTGKINVRNQ